MDAGMCELKNLSDNHGKSAHVRVCEIYFSATYLSNSKTTTSSLGNVELHVFIVRYL